MTKIPETHHIKWTRQALVSPPFDGIQIDRRLIMRTHDAVNMSDAVFLMRVVPPSLENPDVFRSDFDAICSVADLFTYPFAVLNESDLKTIEAYRLKKEMLVYVIGANKIFQLTGQCSDPVWKLYDPEKNKHSCPGKNGLTVTMQLKTIPFYRTNKLDIAIPGDLDETEVYNSVCYYINRLCRRLDYWDAVSREEYGEA